MEGVIVWIFVAVLCIILVLYILYLRHKKAVDRATSRFAKWGTVGAYIFTALFCAALLYVVYAQSEPDFLTAWKEHWFNFILGGIDFLMCVVMAIIHAVRPDRPRAPDDAEVDDVYVGAA